MNEHIKILNCEWHYIDLEQESQEILA